MLIKLLRSGNRVVVETADPVILAKLRHALSYLRRDSSSGGSAKAQIRETRNHVWSIDIRKRLFTLWGYYDLIVETLHKEGHTTSLVELTKPAPASMEVDWNALPDHGFVPRFGQVEALSLIATADNGIIDAVPGWGKGSVIGIACAALPKARIAIITYSRKLMSQRLMSEVYTYCPGAGVFHGGCKRPGRRVNMYTAGCLGYANFDETDLVLVDEVHQLATDRIAEYLVRFQNARMFGFSATVDKRWDGGDFRLLGLFGPTRLVIDRKLAEHHEAIVPTYVRWRSLSAVSIPDYGYYRSRAARLKQMYWQNAYRNAAIAYDARSYPVGTQILIYSHTVEHALRLKRVLPEFEVVYAPRPLNGVRKKLADAMQLPEMTPERYEMLARDFSSGRLKRAICTPCWGTGVNFTKLSVLIRADGGQARIENGQVTGRPNRANKGKTHAIIHDYCDEYNPWAFRRAKQRHKDYAAEGLRNVLPPGAFKRR